jgi:hypothetical protein
MGIEPSSPWGKGEEEGKGDNHQTTFISNDFKEVVGNPKS